MSANRLVITQVTCNMASSGVSASLPAWNAGISTVFGAVAAAAGVAAGAGVAVGTGGIGIPLAVTLPALMGMSASALSMAVTTAGAAAITSIGHSLPDQLYITVNGNKIFPHDSKYVDIKTGDTLMSRGPGGSHPGTGGSGASAVLLRGGENGQEVWRQDGNSICDQTFSGNQALIEIWDWDAITSDDKLGYYSVSLNQGKPLDFIAMGSQEEDSLYIMGVGVLEVS
jgi:hypothetical protein